MIKKAWLKKINIDIRRFGMSANETTAFTFNRVSLGKEKTKSTK